MHEERLASSPHIQFIWRAYAQKAGTFNDLAHDFWVLVFRTLNGKTEVKLTGPIMRSMPISYEEGQYSWGIVFKAHVFIFNLPKKDMFNTSVVLPMASEKSFLIGKHEIPLPDFENAEDFVEQLITRNILNANLAIAKALAGNKPPMSSRTLQRHYLKTTGITQSKSLQIERARKAFILLQEGLSIADVVFEAGYADQAHLTRSLKLLAGQTPRQIIMGAP